MAYRTPGVYIKEVSLFPPSVAEVETAIPAFIGYTERADENGEDLTNVPTRIKSLLEYRERFGGAPTPTAITVSLDATNRPTRVDITPRFYLYHSLQLFYDNGGGDCYIVSVGRHTANAVALGDPTDPANNPGLLVGLRQLEKYDEPTIILFPDAVLFGNNNLYALQQQALAQCERLQDRVCVFDLYEARGGNPNFDWADGVDEFRNQIGINNLKYGAAYVPHLRTTLPYRFEYSDLTFNKGGGPVSLANLSGDPAPVDRLTQAVADRTALRNFVARPRGNANPALRAGYDAIATAGRQEVVDRVTYLHDVAQALLALAAAGTVDDPEIEAALARVTDEGNAPNFGRLERIVRTLRRYDQEYFDGTVAAPNADALDVFDPAADYADYDFAGVAPAAAANSIYNAAGNVGDNENARAANARGHLGVLFDEFVAEVEAVVEGAETRVATLEQELKNTNAIYANVVRAVEQAGSTLPPSGAIAGIYSYVDRTRGVWKAPANVSLSSVLGPTVQIDHFDQERLNVDTNAGKSINAIRAFAGKGTLVWGARTLAGNDNEWRYVPVRRFYNMVEESVKKSTAWAVFEPNDAGLWTRVKAMIDNYLTQKWQDGALQGATPEEAFFVKVGLGLTMTPIDVLEGRMIVQIGMAVVRPAEFIILEFSHKMLQVA